MDVSARGERAAAARRQSSRKAATRKSRAGVKSQVAGPKGESVWVADVVSSRADLVRSWLPGKGFEEVAKVWDQISGVVQSALLGLDFGGEKRAREFLSSLSRHTAARYSSGDRIDSLELLLGDEALAATLGVHRQSMSRYSKGTLRRDLGNLRRLRALLLPDLFAKHEVLNYGVKKGALAYSEGELAQLFSYARGGSNPNTKYLLAALLLSLGAGLSGRELTLARGSDLVATPWGIFIESVGLSSGGNRGRRLVPILAIYEDELSDLAAAAGDGLLLGAKKSGGEREPSELHPRRSDLPIFQTNRARANWMRSLLINEVSFIAMITAGVGLAKEGYLVELSMGLEPDFESYVRQVRGVGAAFDQSRHQHLMQYAQGQ